MIEDYENPHEEPLGVNAAKNESQLLVSVVTPVFNSEAYLDEAIASVCSQSYSNIEYLLIDDCSSDKSVDIIKAWAKRDSRITPISLRKNGGPAAARNAAIKIARGKFVAFLDADDKWSPSKLEKQIAVFNENLEVGLVGTEINRIDANGQSFDSRDISWGRVSVKDYLIRGLPLYTSSIVLKKQCLDELGAFSLSYAIGEDYELWFRISRYYELQCVAEALVDYRVHDSNITKNKLRNRSSKVLLLENEVLNKPDILEEAGDEFIRIMQRKYCSLAKLYAKHNDTVNARMMFNKSLSLNPGVILTLKALILRWWHC